ncbi:MAG: amidohydrolase family protein [Longimicrobiales bacterium]
MTTGSAFARSRVDGIQGNSTARFYEPQLHSGSVGEWRDSTNTAATDGPGSGMNPPGNMERLLFGLDSAGWWANVHAIGDFAIDSVLTIMEKVTRVNGPKERRWRIIHSQVIRNAEVAQRYKRLGIIAEVQPYPPRARIARVAPRCALATARLFLTLTGSDV